MAEDSRREEPAVPFAGPLDEVFRRLDRIEAKLAHIAWTLSKKRRFFAEADSRKASIVEAIEYNRKQGLTIRQACRKQGVSISAYQRYRIGAHKRTAARVAAGQPQDGATFAVGDPLFALDAEE